MEALKTRTSEMIVRESGERWPDEAVEGTGQCEQCRRFMKLGEAGLCLGETENLQQASLIVGRVPGQCALFLKSSSPFEAFKSE